MPSCRIRCYAFLCVIRLYDKENLSKTRKMHNFIWQFVWHFSSTANNYIDCGKKQRPPEKTACGFSFGEFNLIAEKCVATHLSQRSMVQQQQQPRKIGVFQRTSNKLAENMSACISMVRCFDCLWSRIKPETIKMSY